MLAIAVPIFLAPRYAAAETWVWVPDLSLLKYQTYPDGKLYLRNLNEFNSNALGCCYNYYVDTTTIQGKNIFALILTKAAQGKGLYLGVPDGFAAGGVSYVGEW